MRAAAVEEHFKKNINKQDPEKKIRNKNEMEKIG